MAVKVNKRTPVKFAELFEALRRSRTYVVEGRKIEKAEREYRELLKRHPLKKFTWVTGRKAWGYKVYFKVENQYFCVSEGCETREHAEWFRAILIGALERFVEKVKG